MNALEIIKELRVMLCVVIAYQPNIEKKISELEQSLTPSVEQEEILEIVDWLTTGHPTKQSFIDGLRKDGYVDLANDYIEDDKKCDKLRQHILQPNESAIWKDKFIAKVLEHKEDLKELDEMKAKLRRLFEIFDLPSGYDKNGDYSFEGVNLWSELLKEIEGEK